MPSPQAAPAIEARPTLATRIEGVLLMALCIFLGIVLPLLLRSRFDGVWFRTGGDQNAPAEMKVIAHHSKFSIIIPINCFDPYETVTLIADGRQHVWSEPPSNCHFVFEHGINTYTAQLTNTSFKLTKSTDSATFNESWEIIASGRMVVSQHGQTATYQRASWLRSLFTEEP